MTFHYGYNYDDVFPDFVPKAVDYVVGTAPAGEDPEQYDDIAAFHAGFLAGTVTNSGPADNLTALNKETVKDGVVEQAAGFVSNDSGSGSGSGSGSTEGSDFSLCPSCHGSDCPGNAALFPNLWGVLYTAQLYPCPSTMNAAMEGYRGRGGAGASVQKNIPVARKALSAVEYIDKSSLSSSLNTYLGGMYEGKSNSEIASEIIQSYAINKVTSKAKKKSSKPSTEISSGFANRNKINDRKMKASTPKEGRPLSGDELDKVQEVKKNIGRKSEAGKLFHKEKENHISTNKDATNPDMNQENMVDVYENIHDNDGKFKGVNKKRGKKHW